MEGERERERGMKEGEMERERRWKEGGRGREGGRDGPGKTQREGAILRLYETHIRNM